jgi:hypothetical protein
MRVPSISLAATDGSQVDLSSTSGSVVVYAYPRTGVPDKPNPDGWGCNSRRPRLLAAKLRLPRSLHGPQSRRYRGSLRPVDARYSLPARSGRAFASSVCLALRRTTRADQRVATADLQSRRNGAAEAYDPRAARRRNREGVLSRLSARSKRRGCAAVAGRTMNARAVVR